EELDIYPSSLTDAGVKALQNLPLKRIDLRRNGITDASLQMFSRMPLYYLNVRDTQVTNKGLQQLRKAIPTIDLSPVGLPDSPAEAPAVAALTTRGVTLAAHETGHIVEAEQYGIGYAIADESAQKDPSFDEICDLLAKLPY